MNYLEKLYYNMDKLNDNWVDTPEVKAASDQVKLINCYAPQHHLWC